MFMLRPSLTNAGLDTFLWLIWVFLNPNLLCVLRIKTTSHQKAPWTHTQVRSPNSILTWPCSAVSNPHLFPFPSFLLLLSHPVDPIKFCGSFQKRVWNGALFASPKKSKEMEKVQLHCNFLVVQRLIVIQWPDILFPGKREKKNPNILEHDYVPSTHHTGTICCFTLTPAISFFFFFFLAKLMLLVSCLLLVQICFYILIPLWLLFSCPLYASYYVLSTATQPKEKNNAMWRQWASK